MADRRPLRAEPGDPAKADAGRVTDIVAGSGLVLFTAAFLALLSAHRSRFSAGN